MENLSGERRTALRRVLLSIIVNICHHKAGMNGTKTSDILIVGGGVIGLTLARALRKKGARKITILERGASVGRESSHAAAGMLAPHAECERTDSFFYFCKESSALYPDFARELFDETGVDIELDRSGTLYLAFTEADSAEIRERYERQKKAAFPVEYLTANDARRAEPFVSPDVREGLFFPDDWQVENRKLLHALEKFAEFNDIEIRANVEVANLQIENGAVSSVETSAGNFSAQTVLLATGAWTSFVKAGDLNLPPVKPMRGQMISFHTAKRLFSGVIYSPRGYIVPRADGRILCGATIEDAGFDKSLTDAGVEFLRQNAFEIAPNLASLEISEKWSGLRPFAPDGLPVLGAVAGAKNLFIATAHYRNGILLAPLTAKILSDKILENVDSKYLDAFSPQRFQTAKTF